VATLEKLELVVLPLWNVLGRFGNPFFVFCFFLSRIHSERDGRFRTNSEVLPEVIAQLFPTLVSIATQMLSTPSSSQEIPTMLHLILKTYKTSIVVNLSKHQQSPESLVPWGQLLFRVVSMEIPRDAVPQDEDDREKSEWWKAKKWAYGILGKLFHRYTTPLSFSGVIYHSNSPPAALETHLSSQAQCRPTMVHSHNTL
jgi:hypothetical protein